MPIKSSLRERIYALMRDGQPRSLFEIRAVVGGSDSGISAKLRDLRKARYGGHTVESKCVDRKRQVYKYRVIVGRPEYLFDVSPGGYHR